MNIAKEIKFEGDAYVPIPDEEKVQELDVVMISGKLVQVVCRTPPVYGKSINGLHLDTYEPFIQAKYRSKHYLQWIAFRNYIYEKTQAGEIDILIQDFLSSLDGDALKLTYDKCLKTMSFMNNEQDLEKPHKL